MDKVYFLQGLDCANCASKIENAVSCIDGVAFASVNFVNTTLNLSLKEDYSGDIDLAVNKAVHKYEPEIIVHEKSARLSAAKHGLDKTEVYKLITGAVLFAAGMILTHALKLNACFEFSIFFLSYLILGGAVILKAVKNISKGQIFDENFLMGVATIGAFCIGDFPEAAAVMLFYQLGEFFQEAAVRKSRNSIAELMDIRPDYANIEMDGELSKVSPETVNIGDIIVVKPGEKIPLDGVVISGESTLDTSALTGESAPRPVSAGKDVLSGCINQNGVLKISVSKPFGESAAVKIIDLVENASNKKAPTENFITTFSRYYTPAVVGLAVLLATIAPLFFGGDWSEWINKGLVFLVISCPCALIISIPLGFFGGIGGASRRGILVKGANYLEALNHLETVVFDKTGTLTKGVFKVTDIYTANGFTKNELLEFAACAEAFSNHPISISIQSAFGRNVDKGALKDYCEIPGCGVSVKAGSKSILLGNAKLMTVNGIDLVEQKAKGTKVYVAVDGVFAGCILISDEIKRDSKRAILGLKALGVNKTVMLTGDNADKGKEIAHELGIDEVHAELLPGQKVEILDELESQVKPKGKLAFIGDGINDAPVLARADIGIAMGGLGSDAAVEAADIVLMTDEPSRLLEAVNIAKFTKRIVWQNIAFALGVKGAFLLMGALGIVAMWLAVFADVGVALIAVLNAMRVLKSAE